MQSHFLILHRAPGSHTYVTLIKSGDPLEALHQYIRHEHSDATIQGDGTVLMEYLGRELRYPHALAFIEALYRAADEWQIRELPEHLWQAPYNEGVLVGEHPDEVRAAIQVCRPHLPEEYHRGRPKAFVWYVQAGTLVTVLSEGAPI